MTSHLSASQKKKKKGKVGVKEFFATSYLVTKSQITSLFLAHSLSGSPFRSVTQMVLHTHTQTPAQCCQQSPLTVYHGCGNSSSVMRKTLAKTSMRIWTLHTHGHTTLFKIQPFICPPLLSNICCSRGYPHHVFVCNARLRGITINS